MKKFGIQFNHERLESSSEKVAKYNESTEHHEEIKEVLRKFQVGYSERDIEKTETFVEKLFLNGENTCVLGTGTGELFLGSEQIKTLIRDDWQYWGDVTIDTDNAYISAQGNTAWFSTSGSVKYSFEDTPERYDSYLNFIKSKREDSELNPRQKITFINWVLALTYHQRPDKRREYLWQMCLSGLLLKESGNWKIANLQFSLPKSNFPDERFESSKDYLENYNKQNDMVIQYKNNQMTKELKSLLRALETKFTGEKDVSRQLVGKNFAADNIPYIIGTDGKWYVGVDRINNFFAEASDSKLSLDLEHAIASKSGEIIWVTVTGTLKQHLTEDELAERALKEFDNLFNADISSKEKLFAAHRSIAYALKEGAEGEDYICPIRLTAVIKNQNPKPQFLSIHFSFPSYWIFEGKLDGI